MPSLRGALLATTTLLSLCRAMILPNELRSLEDLQDLHKRCNNPCGSGGWLCCPDDTTCYTDSEDKAQCASGGYITSTYVLTNLQTVTTTIAIGAAQTGSSCKWSIGETSCGSTCCNSQEFCASQENSICQDNGAGSSGYYSSLRTVTTIITNTAAVGTASQPFLPTSNTVVTVTATGTAGELTTTRGFIAPTSTIISESSGGGGGGLSGGAIAGIVIGVLAAIIILILICLCCCAKGILDTILGIFGLGDRKRRRTEEVEVYESRHHHGSRRGRSASAAGRRTWFGTKPRRSTSVVEEKKSSGWGRAVGVTAGLAGLAAFLGLKRRRDRKDHKSEVSYGSSYYSDYTSSEFTPNIITKFNTD
ncbi:uncharacterized protein AB675_11954 [Cyphellophora attinorum]|uniref:Mid2 domain-containing protein n=1 Tax=Cyphellophora attinorum TaxID=1664694 RepID=A0A0N1NVX0_9EURO|nr:uncharacterized protein AB675_11954 [Phialophora attinorum]KPI35007.1 hypothetical protein AB675_11954 [Phialophora attinorum]